MEEKGAEKKNIAVSNPDMSLLSASQLPISSFGLLSASFAQQIIDRGTAGTEAVPMFTLNYLEEDEPASAQEVKISPVLNLDYRFFLQQMDRMEKLQKNVKEDIKFVQEGDVYRLTPMTEVQNTHYHLKQITEQCARLQEQRQRKNGQQPVIRKAAGTPEKESKQQPVTEDFGQNPLFERSRKIDSERTVDTDLILKRIRELTENQRQQEARFQEKLDNPETPEEERQVRRKKNRRQTAKSGKFPENIPSAGTYRGIVEKSSVRQVPAEKLEAWVGEELRSLAGQRDRAQNSSAENELRSPYLPEKKAPPRRKPVGVWSPVSGKFRDGIASEQIEMLFSNVIRAEQKLGLTYGASADAGAAVPMDRAAYLKETTKQIARKEQLAERLQQISYGTLPEEELYFLEELTGQTNVPDRLLRVAEEEVRRALDRKIPGAVHPGNSTTERAAVTAVGTEQNQKSLGDISGWRSSIQSENEGMISHGNPAEPESRFLIEQIRKLLIEGEAEKASRLLERYRVQLIHRTEAIPYDHSGPAEIDQLQKIGQKAGEETAKAAEAPSKETREIETGAKEYGKTENETAEDVSENEDSRKNNPVREPDISITGVRADRDAEKVPGMHPEEYYRESVQLDYLKSESEDVKEKQRKQPVLEGLRDSADTGITEKENIGRQEENGKYQKEKNAENIWESPEAPGEPLNYRGGIAELAVGGPAAAQIKNRPENVTAEGTEISPDYGKTYNLRQEIIRSEAVERFLLSREQADSLAVSEEIALTDTVKGLIEGGELGAAEKLLRSYEESLAGAAVSPEDYAGAEQLMRDRIQAAEVPADGLQNSNPVFAKEVFAGGFSTENGYVSIPDLNYLEEEADDVLLDRLQEQIRSGNIRETLELIGGYLEHIEVRSPETDGRVRTEEFFRQLREKLEQKDFSQAEEVLRSYTERLNLQAEISGQSLKREKKTGSEFRKSAMMSPEQFFRGTEELEYRRGTADSEVKEAGTGKTEKVSERKPVVHEKEEDAADKARDIAEGKKKISLSVPADSLEEIRELIRRKDAAAAVKRITEIEAVYRREIAQAEPGIREKHGFGTAGVPASDNEKTEFSGRGQFYRPETELNYITGEVPAAPFAAQKAEPEAKTQGTQKAETETAEKGSFEAAGIRAENSTKAEFAEMEQYFRPETELSYITGEVSAAPSVSQKAEPEAKTQGTQKAEAGMAEPGIAEPEKAGAAEPGAKAPSAGATGQKAESDVKNPGTQKAEMATAEKSSFKAAGIRAEDSTKAEFAEMGQYFRPEAELTYISETASVKEESARQRAGASEEKVSGTSGKTSLPAVSKERLLQKLQNLLRKGQVNEAQELIIRYREAGEALSGKTGIMRVRESENKQGERIFRAAAEAGGKPGSEWREAPEALEYLEVFAETAEPEMRRDLKAGKKENRQERTVILRSDLSGAGKDEDREQALSYNAQNKSGFNKNIVKTPLSMAYAPLTGGPGNTEGAAGSPESENRDGKPFIKSSAEKSEYYRNLPEWTRKFLEAEKSESGERDSGRDAIPAGETASSKQMTWTNPAYRQAPEAYAPMHEIVLKEKGEVQTVQTHISEREIRRTAEKVYQILEERLRNERRRHGF